jgi:hypothetical protein
LQIITGGKMDKVINLNKKETQIIKNALENQKLVVRIKLATDNTQRKELAINELYNIENIEKKLKGL